MLPMPTPWKMEFHHKHGRFITLSKTDSRATREGDTYDHGVVFSRRPLKIGEIFQLKIEQMETKWAGSLRLGVTLKNPNCPHTNVVRAATDLFVDDCKDFWILSGSRIHNGTLEKEYDLNIHSLKVNDCVGVQVTDKGQLVFYANGVNQGVAFSGLPVQKHIFGIFDVYGRTKEVTWKYYGAETLDVLCKKVILRTISSNEDLDKLPLPFILIEFLKEGL